MQITIDLDVTDIEQLYAAALEHAICVDELTSPDAVLILRPDGDVDIGACMITLLDPGTLPGCSINESFIVS